MMQITGNIKVLTKKQIMKTIKILTLILSIVFVNIAAAQDSAELKEIKFKANVDCNMCKAKIEKNMAFSKGVKAVNADVATKTVTIKYKTDKTTPKKLETDLKKCGYGAELVSAKSNCSKKCNSHQTCGSKNSKKKKSCRPEKK